MIHFAAAVAVVWLGMGLQGALLNRRLVAHLSSLIEIASSALGDLDALEARDPDAYLLIASDAARLAVARDALCLLYDDATDRSFGRVLTVVLAGPVVTLILVARSVRLGGRVAALLHRMRNRLEV